MDPQDYPSDSGQDGTFGNWNSIRFADNYYQIWRGPVHNLDGFHIEGAFEVDLSPFFEQFKDASWIKVSHELVHTCYHGTIDIATTNKVDGKDIPRTQWYGVPAEQQPTVGYYYSRVGQGQRQVGALAASSAPRSFVAPLPSIAASDIWDNVEITGVSGSASTNVIRWDFLRVIGRFQDRNGDATVTLGFDTDGNPYNGTAAGRVLTANDRTEEAPFNNASLDSSLISAGTYLVFAKISNGTRTRYYYFPQEFRVLENQAPRLANPRVSPISGTTSETFAFRVDYFDPEGNPMNYSVGGTVSTASGRVQGATVSIVGGEVNQRATTASDGTYAFSNLKGGVPYTLTASHPDHPFTPADLNIPNLTASGSTYNFAGVNQDGIAPLITLTQKPDRFVEDRNQVSFTWSGSDNKTPANLIEYSYQLVGSANESFTPWATAATAIFTLPNGAYTFRIKARDQAANESILPVSHTFAVSAAPRVTQVHPLSNGPWLTEATVSMPTSASQAGSKMVTRASGSLYASATS